MAGTSTSMPLVACSARCGRTTLPKYSVSLIQRRRSTCSPLDSHAVLARPLPWIRAVTFEDEFRSLASPARIRAGTRINTTAPLSGQGRALVARGFGKAVSFGSDAHHHRCRTGFARDREEASALGLIDVADRLPRIGQHVPPHEGGI